MDFLGNVNVFHGRVEGGRAVLGGLELAYPDYPHEEAQPATVYVRPHELEIDRTSNGRQALQAKVVHINPARPVVKVELLAEEFGAAGQRRARLGPLRRAAARRGRRRVRRPPEAAGLRRRSRLRDLRKGGRGG